MKTISRSFLGLATLTVTLGCSSEPKPEKEEPRLGSWAEIAPMPESRYGACAVQLSDGRVLVAGGVDSSVPDSQLPGNKEALVNAYRASTFFYDPSTNTWSAGPSMREAHAFMPCFVAPDGAVLVVGHRYEIASNLGGGVGEGAFKVDVFDPRTNEWSTSDLPRDGSQPGRHVVMLDDGRLVLLGGFTQTQRSDEPSLKVNISDSNGWSELPDLPDWIGRDSIVLPLPGGRVLVGGGNTVNILDVATKTWSSGPALGAEFTSSSAELHTSNSRHSPFHSVNSLSTGGGFAIACSGSYSVVLDMTSLTWRRVPDRSFRKYQDCTRRVLGLADGSVLGIGGLSGGSVADFLVTSASATYALVPALPLFNNEVPADYGTNVALADGRGLAINVIYESQDVPGSVGNTRSFAYTPAPR